MSTKTTLTREVRPIAQGELLTSPAKELPLSEAVASFAALKRIEKLIKKRLELLRGALLVAAEAHGDPLDNGGQRLDISGNVVFRDRRENKIPDEDKLLAYLKSLDIPILDVFDEIKIVEINASKLEHLVKVGKLREKEINEMRAVTHACKVVEGTDLKDLLDEVCGLNEADDEEEKPRAKKRRYFG